MTKLSGRFFLILTISYITNQFTVNSQSTINVTPNGQISNLTLLSILSYTSQSKININQTSPSLFTSSKPNSANITITTIVITTTLPLNNTSSTIMPFSTPLTNLTKQTFPTATNATRPTFSTLTNVTRPSLTISSVITNDVTRTTTVTTTTSTRKQQYFSTSYNSATKCEQYITLLIPAHFLLLIFPIH